MGSAISLAVLDASSILSNLGLTPSRSLFHTHMVWIYGVAPFYQSSREKGLGSKIKITKATLFEFLKYLTFISGLDFVIRGIGLICLKPPGKGHIQDFLLRCNRTILFWVTEKTGWAHSSMTQDYIWKLIIFAYHSCMVVFLFNGQVLLPWKHFWFPGIYKKLFITQAMLASQHSFIWLL